MRVYLDSNATAPLRPEARAAMLAVMDHAANPSSIHVEGRNARRAVDEARAAVAGFTGALPEHVTFTSGGTEAAGLAINGALLAAAEEGRRFTRLIVSAVEHDCVLQAATRASEMHPGLRLSHVGVDTSGVLRLADLERELAEGKGRALVSVMAVNNETGVIQPVQQVAELCRRHGAVFHCDAVQAAGKIACRLDDLGADIMTLSAHKMGGPQGAGAMVRRAGIPVASLVRGGAQEFGLRAGTENVAAIAGFGAAIRALAATPEQARMHDALEARLMKSCPEARIFGAGAPRVGTTTCIAAPGVTAETLVIALDLDGFSVSAGAACSSGRVTQSHVLAAMGVEPELARCAIRVSAGWHTQAADLEAFAEAWTRIVSRARSRAAA